MKLTTVTKNILKGSLYVLLVAVTVYLYPRYQHSFAYRYEVGKPWSYNKLVADFDFPVYKSAEQLEDEKAEVLCEMVPYFAYVEGQPRTPLVIAADELERLQDDGYDRLAILQKQVAHTYSLDKVYTPKSAYLAFGENMSVNIVPDTAATNQLCRELIGSISLTHGMVQAGEKIIDKGEIVDEQTEAILYSLRKAMEQSQSPKLLSIWVTVGNLVLVCLYLLMLVLYLYVFRPQFFGDTKVLLFFTLLPMLIIVLTCLEVRYTNWSIYLIPVVWIPVLIHAFFDARTALFVHLVTVMILSLAVPNSFEFLVLQVAAGMVAVASMKEMTRRAQLAQTAGWILLTYVVAYTAFVLCTSGSWSQINPWMYLYFGINAILVIFAYGLLYLVERVFRLISPITLVELTDINSSLLLEFAEKAPGSFQHSMQVSTLAMEAAKRVGANSLLVRTGALYHDIGKMNHASLFVENQQEGENPLLNMDPQQAAKMVIAHVADGVAIAKAYHLPQVIINFIETHHGSSLARYFYNTEVNRKGEANEQDFRYPDAKPTTREAAILMMADAVEARSRSLRHFTEESINEAVDDMINQQINDGQFSETPISFRDVEIIRQVFKERLLMINHQRIKYPTIESKE